jgi:hypothetical protein
MIILSIEDDVPAEEVQLLDEVRLVDRPTGDILYEYIIGC